MQKYILPLLLAYKLKFFTMIPLILGKYMEMMKKETAVKHTMGPMMSMVNNMKKGTNSLVMIVIALLKNLIGGLMAALTALEDYLSDAAAPLDLAPLPSYLEPITDMLQPQHRDEGAFEKIATQLLPLLFSSSKSSSSSSLIEVLLSAVLMSPMSLLLPPALKPKPRPLLDLMKKFFSYKSSFASKIWQWEK